LWIVAVMTVPPEWVRVFCVGPTLVAPVIQVTVLFVEFTDPLTSRVRALLN
jgi:hypothetical protein